MRFTTALLALAAGLTLTSAAFAAQQMSSTSSTDNGAAYEPRQWVVSAGLGFGDAGYYGTDQSPLYGITAEYGYNDKISIGGMIGHSGSSEHFLYAGTDYKATYGYTLVAARGSYHFGDQLKVENLDAYAGVTLGYNSVSVKLPSISGYSFSAGGSATRVGIYGGGRYWFNPRWAGYGEIGIGIGNLVLGVSTRF
jgi:hypothetical protein